MIVAPRYALVLEYDGRELCGSQFQKNGPTVQGFLEEALGTVLRHFIRCDFAGRTDSGVHATGQVACFETTQQVADLNFLMYSLNGLLPKSISIRSITAVPADFHPRFSCLAREYEFLIWNGSQRTAHWEGRAVWFPKPLPVAELNAELQTVCGHHDFAAFAKTRYIDKTTIRYLERVELRRVRDLLSDTEDLVVFSIRANAFLHNMIRILAGTLLDRARGKISQTLGEILASRNRLNAGHTAPAHGLYFRRAYYAPLADVTGLDFHENPEMERPWRRKDVGAG